MWKGVNIMIDDNKKQNDQSQNDDTTTQDQGQLGGEAVENTDTEMDDDTTNTQ